MGETEIGMAGIMNAPDLTLDVRDMLCAQALAVVAQALEGLEAGGTLEVVYNADDVRRDLLVWARDRGHAVVESGDERLRVQRGR